ncbi:MAG: class I SAM-dependent methyltransferase [Acidimicrobiia bacterium]|nr:MAG: class I SAM-dependent methyltransferase [Acidimicrobiia bacterium]
MRSCARWLPSPCNISAMSHEHGKTPAKDEQFDEAFWDERYSARPERWAGKPHVHLVSETADLKPGSALDVGTGEGADAIWLAERGWQVTAVDISSVALDRGRAQANRTSPDVAGRIEWVHADLTDWVPPPASFDLVSAHNFHLPSQQRLPTYQHLFESVASGGVLLIVGHHPSDLDTTARRLPDPDPLFTADELVDELGEGWTIVAADTRPRTERNRSGESITVHDAVLVARRKD